MTGSALARYELRGTFHASAGRAKASSREVQEGDRDGIESGFDHRRIFVFALGITLSTIFAFPGDAKIALCWTYVGARLGRRLGAVLERSWEVFGKPRRPQDAHKTAQEVLETPPRRPQEDAQKIQRRLKTTPNPPQKLPDLDFGASGP